MHFEWIKCMNKIYNWKLLNKRFLLEPKSVFTNLINNIEELSVNDLDEFNIRKKKEIDYAIQMNTHQYHELNETVSL